MGEIPHVARPRTFPDPDETLVDPVELYEIVMLSEVMIAASGSPHPLSMCEIDGILGVDAEPVGHSKIGALGESESRQLRLAD